MANYNSVDLVFGWNGDYSIGKDGDLADTSSDKILSFIQEIRTVVASNLGDWEEHPKFAASLEDYIGEPNNRDTANLIADRVKTSLISNRVVQNSDLAVRVIPTGISQVLIVIKVKAAATEDNSLNNEQGLVVSLLFDYVERGVLFLDSPV